VNLGKEYTSVDKTQCTLPKWQFGWQTGNSMSEPKGEDLRQEILKYKRLMEGIPDPNCGRIKELKEAIRKGTFLSKEAILETAERIAARFLGKE